jgi:DNA-binding IclR family transcriptional regulator
MKINLALYILRHMILSASIGQGAIVGLSQYRKEKGIPVTTFHRHINTLISEGYIARVGRDRYTLRAEFIDHVMIARHQLPLEAGATGDQWQEFPF